MLDWPITVTVILLVVLLVLVVAAIVAIVVAIVGAAVVVGGGVVLLLSLLLISRSSGDNSEKNSWQFSGVFSGFLCSFLKVHLSKARRMASTLPPNFSQNSSRSRAWNDLDVNPLMWKHIGGINNFRTFKWNWLVSCIHISTDGCFRVVVFRNDVLSTCPQQVKAEPPRKVWWWFCPTVVFSSFAVGWTHLWFKSQVNNCC